MLLEVSGSTARYGSIPAPRDVETVRRAGEVVGLIGPNGAPRTTLLNTIALDTFVRGSAA
jgi:ABC-type branched-subunit amino acid transport system ATPase component